MPHLLHVLHASLVLFSLGSMLSCGSGNDGSQPGQSANPPIGSTPLTVNSTSPGANATGVSLNTAISFTFNQTIAPNTFSSATVTLDPPVNGTVSAAGTTGTFSPLVPFAPNTTYTATLSTAITSATGNALVTPFSLGFTTGSVAVPTPPTVTTKVPASGATGVSVSSSITATFSQVMNATTITPLTMTLSTGGVSVAGTVTPGIDTARFTPSLPLQAGTSYTVTLTTGITDITGNHLASDVMWVFTTITAPVPETGLDFPGSAAVPNNQTMRFRFTNPQSNGLPIYGPGGTGVTYIWRAYPRQQSGYYTAFFWGNDNGKDFNENFLWNNGSSDTFYGAHPYPDMQPNGSTHQWEIAAQGNDFVNGVVVYNRWYTQALRVWADGTGKHHEFYWDLPNTDADHRVTVDLPTSYGNLNPPVPALTWGDAPWNPSAEVWNGVLRGIQIYAAKLTLTDILNEISSPTSTTAGTNSIWYLNLNPTPTDIADKSGKGHNPEWVGNLRPMLYIAP